MPTEDAVFKAKVDLFIKSADVLSWHLIEEHKRAQLEVYRRLQLRSQTINHMFAILVAFTGAISFAVKSLFDENGIYLGSDGASATFVLIYFFIVVLLLCAVHLLRTYITHCHHIYSASKYIYSGIGPKVKGVADGLSSSAASLSDNAADQSQIWLVPQLGAFRINDWETQLYIDRMNYRFKDKDGDAVILWSIISFSFMLLPFPVVAFWNNEVGDGIGLSLIDVICFMMFLILAIYSILLTSAVYRRYLKLNQCRADLNSNAEANAKAEAGTP